MNIRLAEEKDIDSVIKLLTQVLNIHAKIRPDIWNNKIYKRGINGNF